MVHARPLAILPGVRDDQLNLGAALSQSKPPIKASAGEPRNAFIEPPISRLGGDRGGAAVDSATEAAVATVAAVEVCMWFSSSPASPPLMDRCCCIVSHAGFLFLDKLSGCRTPTL